MNDQLNLEKAAEIPEWILTINEKAIANKQPFSLQHTIPKGEQHTDLFRFGSSLRAKGSTETEIVAAFIAVNGRLEEPAPLENLEKLAQSICKQYKPGTSYEENYNDSGWEGFATSSKDQKTTRENGGMDAEKNKENETVHSRGLEQGGKNGKEDQSNTGDNIERSAEENKIDFPIEALGAIMAAPAKILAEKIGVPIEIVCSSMLAAAALCVQEHYDLDFFGGVRPLSLFFLTIAESGERKSTVDKLVLREHNEWRSKKQKIYIEALIRYKEAMEVYKSEQHKKQNGLTKPIPPKAPVLFASEPTVEGLFFCLKYHRNSIGIFSDEGGSFLGGHSMRQDSAKSSLAKLNQLWDGSAIDRIRKGSTEEGEVDILEGKRVSMHLMIQPSVAADIFNNEHAKSMGFLARCLTCQPQSKIGTRDFNMTITAPGEIYKFYDRVRLFLNKGVSERKIVLKITSGAEKLIKDYYHDIEKKQIDGGEFANIKAFASKAIEHCIRIAAVIETFTNQDDAVIDENAISRAIAIIPFYLGAQKKVTEKSCVFPSKECELIHTKIATRKEWTIRDLLRVLPIKYRKKDILMPLVKQLVDAEFCKINPETGRVSI